MVVPEELRPAEGLATATGGLTSHEQKEKVDEYARCEITSVEDFRALFERPFHFGCEADDPTTSWAFARAQ